MNRKEYFVFTIFKCVILNTINTIMDLKERKNKNVAKTNQMFLIQEGEIKRKRYSQNVVMQRHN